ncbi:MAG: hypothetical protein K0U36_06570 [Alphaproteobacteria bacterium]|nr:hypothetical protein [Alphaproteobacteria bacterium]
MPENLPVIVLVRPQLAINIGMVARGMANSSFSALRLVAPRDGWPNDEAFKTATEGKAILENTQLFPTLEQAVADRHSIVATTARQRDRNMHTLAYPDLPTLTSDDAIIFGQENNGLSGDDLLFATHVMHLPVNPHHASLSLPSAVLLTVHSIFVHRAGYVTAPNPADLGQDRTDTPLAPQKPFGIAPTPPQRPASSGLLHNFLHRLSNELEIRGYYRHPAMKRKTHANLNALAQRAQPTEQELNSLHGVVSSLLEKKTTRPSNDPSQH